MAIKIKRGDSYSRIFEVRQNGDLVDCTGWEFKFTVRKTVPPTSETTDTNAVFQKVISGDSSGQHTLEITSADTTIDPKEYLYEFQAKKPDNSIDSTETDIFIIAADLTRSS